MATCNVVDIELEVVHMSHFTTHPQNTLSRSLLDPELELSPAPSRNKRKVESQFSTQNLVRVFF